MITVIQVSDSSSSSQVWYSSQRNRKVWIHQHGFWETNPHSPSWNIRFALSFLGLADTDGCWTSALRRGSPWGEWWHWWRDRQYGSNTRCEYSCRTPRLEAPLSTNSCCSCSRHPTWCIRSGNLCNEKLKIINWINCYISYTRVVLFCNISSIRTLYFVIISNKIFHFFHFHFCLA